jgi:Fur family ferric uptake transcriptional regulator|tara:strand:- start:439 stop:876 length:438 start_codon:yes stop_codon:yes gene_type:complete
MIKKQKKYMEQFLSALKEENLKATTQRVAIFEEVIYGEKHRECEQICDSLKSSKVNISRATVYRTLDTLIKYEFIRKMDIGDGRIRYESKIGHPHHDHMICVETGKIIEFTSDEIENIQDDIAKEHGYKIIKHIHQLFVKPINND